MTPARRVALLAQTPLGRVVLAGEPVAFDFDPAEHPRGEPGSPTGGQFVSKGDAGHTGPATIRGQAVRLENGKVVEGPKELLGRTFAQKKSPPPSPPVSPKPAAAPPPPKPAASAPAASAPKSAPKPLAFRTGADAVSHFATTYRTNIQAGKGISEKEFPVHAAHLANEMGRIAGLKAVAAALRKRSSRGQSLTLGYSWDSTQEAGVKRGQSSTGGYVFGEGIRLAANPVVPDATPNVGGGHTVGGDLGTTYRHELGHEVLASGVPAGKRREWVRKFGKYVGTPAVSRYGGTNENELFSEAFAAYTSKNYRRGSLPADMETWLDKNVRG